MTPLAPSPTSQTSPTTPAQPTTGPIPASRWWTGRPGELRPPRWQSPQARLADGSLPPTAATVVGRWQERYLVHGEGDVLAQRVRLTPFERYWLSRALEYDPVTGRLLHDRVLIGVAKGNIKSEGAGRFAVTELCGPIAPVSPRIVINATGLHQTGEVFTSARLAITGTEEQPGPLADHFLPGVHILDDLIRLPDGHGYIERLTSGGGTNDGGKPTDHIADELHEWVTEAQERSWTIQGKGLRKRVVPRRTPAALGLPPGVRLTGGLQIGITTQGGRSDTMLGRLYEHGVKVARGEVEDPGFLFLWWEADEAWDLEDPAQLDQALLQANPCIGETVPLENKRRSFLDPLLSRADALRYDLNLSSADEERWIRRTTWAACAGDTTPATGSPAFAAVSVGHEHRAAAVAVAQRRGDGCTLRVATFPDDGAVSAEIIPVGVLEAHIRTLRAVYPASVIAVRRAHPKAPERRFGVPGPELISHGAFFEGSAQRLDGEGMAVHRVTQSQAELAPMAETMRGLAIEGHLIHDGGPELARQVGLVLADTAAGGWRVLDAGPAARAAMVAVHRAMTAPRPTSGAKRTGVSW